MTPGTRGDDLDAVVIGQALLQAGNAGPGSVLDALRTVLGSVSLSADLVLYLVDYRLRELLPVTPAGATLLPPEPVDGSHLGAAFRLQQPVEQTAPAGHLLHVPVTVRGQRLGVLTATFSDPPPMPDQRAVRSVALAAAYLLLEAGTGSDVYELGRRRARLSLAAEMQWQLLPARAFRTPSFCVAGHLEPALRVAGDAFDFAVDDTTLTLAVVDATGPARSGSTAALLSTLAVTALRNARRAGLPLSEQAALASDMVWAHARGEQHACVLLLQIDTVSGTAHAVDAGSGALVRLRGGAVLRTELDRQAPLGLLEDQRYSSELVDLAPGDRLFVLTDTDGQNLRRALELLAQAVDGRRPAPPEAVRQLVTALLDDRQPGDYTTVICLDWSP